MRVSRLYVPMSLSVGETISLAEDNAHYVRTVLRLKKNDAIIVFNGEGGEFSAKLAEVSKKQVLINVQQWQERSVESRLTISAGIGIARGDRMDWAIQKAVELGVNRITPVLTERCVVQLKGEKQGQRLQHWRKISQHAAEQCGRTLVPELSEITPIQKWINNQRDLKVFLDPFAEKILTDLQPINNNVTLLTGPEGGFTGQEREIAKAAGFVPIRLGNRILRTETATIAALAALQMLWGDFGYQGTEG